MIIQEKGIRDEVARLLDIQNKANSLTAAQKKTLAALAFQQSSITQEIRRFAQSIAKAEVFHLSLQLTADVTSDLSRLLGAEELNPLTLALAEEVVERLEQLKTALDESSSNSGKKPGGSKPSEEESQKPQGAADQDGISQTAQLKLLKMMQESLKTRTQKLGESLSDKSIEARIGQDQLKRLAGEQSRLSEMTLNLIETTEEELFDPEQIPDFPPENESGQEAVDDV